MKTHTSNPKHPHLECPNCGQTVLSLKDWRRLSRGSKIYTCPYCQRKYRIPLACQILQNFAGFPLGFLIIILYMEYIEKTPWMLALFSIHIIIEKIIMGIVIVLSTAAWMGIARAVGEKMAYKYPLQKVD